MRIQILLALPLSALLSSCGNFNSVYREFSVGNGDKATKSIAIDVKQRTILSGSPDGTKLVVCAEPSPDALSVYAASLSGTAYAGEKKALDLALSGTETGSYIGNRTETIQLLWDNLYRACEAYMNGAIDGEGYLKLTRRYQVMTMGLLAIERLTTTVKPLNVTLIAGQASASAGFSEDEVEKLSKAKATADAAVVGSKAKVDEAKKTLDQAKTDSDASPANAALLATLATATKDHAAAVKQLQLDEASQKIANQNYQEAKAKAGNSSSVAGGTVIYAPEAAQAQAQAASAVADAAQSIVRMTIDDGFKIEDCFNKAQSCSYGDRLKAVSVAAQACKSITNKDDYNQCAQPILAVAGVRLSDVPELIQSSQDAPTEVRKEIIQSPIQTKDIKLLASNATPTPQALYRVDIFAVPTRASDQQNVLRIINSAKIGTPRLRSVSPADCRGRFAIGTGTFATVRFDETPDETPKKDEVVKALKAANLTVTESAVATPTPLYLSVFLCS